LTLFVNTSKDSFTRPMKVDVTVLGLETYGRSGHADVSLLEAFGPSQNPFSSDIHPPKMEGTGAYAILILDSLKSRIVESACLLP